MGESPNTHFYLRDTTPRAVERNNLSAKVPYDIVRKIVREAILQGVDPYAALAEAWKETILGTAFPNYYARKNPMQYNAEDLAPIVRKRLPRAEMVRISNKVFYDRIQDRIKRSPIWQEATGVLERPSETDQERAFQKARIAALTRAIEQEEYIRGGVGYLKKMIDASDGNLEQSFARYRGKGKGAQYHGKHVLELYEAAKRDPELVRIVKDEGK